MEDVADLERLMTGDISRTLPMTVLREQGPVGLDIARRELERDIS